MAREKRMKIKKSDALSGLREISLGDDEGLSLSIGAMLGCAEAGEKKEKKISGTEAKKATGDATNIAAYLESLQQATLHRESAGRGGRVVTVVSCKPAPPSKLAGELARVMRKGLGCGSHAEGEKIILQGDIQERAEAWLAKQGVKKVVMGN